MSDSKTLGDAASRLVDGVEALAKAAEKIAPEAWATLVRAQVVEGWATVAQWAALVAFSLGLLSFAHRQSKREGFDAESPLFGIPLVVGVLSGVVCIITLLFAGPGTAQQILVPEYAAAQALSEMVKP
jgi:hypothetical protein